MASGKDDNRTINRFAQLTADLPSIAGMRQSGNAASIPSYLFRWIENGAMRGNDLIERGGQARYNPDTPLDDCGDGFLPPDEEPDDHGLRILLQGLVESEEDTDPPFRGYSSGVFALESSLLLPSCLTYLPGSGPNGTGGRLLWSHQTVGDANEPVVSEFSLSGSDVMTVLAERTQTAVGFGGEFARFDGQDFLVIWDETNGATIQVDPLGSGAASEIAFAPAIARVLWLRVFDSHLCCPLSGDVIYRRAAGSAGWDSTTAVLPLNATANTCNAAAVAEWEGGLCFSGVGGSGEYAVFRMAPTTGAVTQFTLAPTPSPTAPAAPSETAQPVCVHNGVLWFADEQNLAYLRPSGEVVDVGAPFGLPSSAAVTTRQLISFRGRLWALRGDELWSSRFPHALASWRRAAILSKGFAYGVVHPIL